MAHLSCLPIRRRSRSLPLSGTGVAGDAAGKGGVAVTPAGRCNATAVGTPSRPRVTIAIRRTRNETVRDYLLRAQVRTGRAH